VFVVGCGLYTGTEPQPDEPAATSYVMVHDDYVHHWLHRFDLVFVFDTTPAMAPLHDRMVANLSRFADAIEQSWSGDIDILAITADPANGGKLLGDVLHLASIPAGGFTHDFDGALSDRLAALVPASFTASSSQPLEELVAALEHDAGFRHGESSLVFVPITGRDDESPSSIESYVAKVSALTSTELRLRLAPIYTQPAARLDTFFTAIQDVYPWRTDLASEDWTPAMMALEVLSDLSLPCLAAPPAEPRDCSISSSLAGVETVLPICNDSISNRPCEEFHADPNCYDSGISPHEQWLRWPEARTRVTIQCVVDNESSSN
jgi:hypothetical protein